MGRDQKVHSDPGRAKAHSAGEDVRVIQGLVHSQLGAVAYTWPRYWTFHQRSFQQARNEFAALHEKILYFPVQERSSTRIIDDQTYLEALYHTGTRVVIESMLMLQHLSVEMARVTDTMLTGSTLNVRLREAFTGAGLVPLSERQGYAKLIEIQGIRDAVEHPKSENVYNAKPGEWDKVPLAWYLSDRSIAAFGGLSMLLVSALTEWEAKNRSDARTMTLEVSRGMYSQLQFKKPPTE